MIDKGEKTTDAGEQVKALLELVQRTAFDVRAMLDTIGESAEQAADLVGDIQRGRPLTRRERILASLASEVRSASYLRDDTGIGASALDAELALMVEDGLVVKRGKGQYQKEIAF